MSEDEQTEHRRVVVGTPEGEEGPAVPDDLDEDPGASSSTSTALAVAELAAAETVEGVVPPAPAQPPGKTPFRLGNRPPLTGVRALALATVLVFHSNFKTMPGAWVALQIFFVLSGFLITAMLASEGERNGRVSLKRFYGRRAARLLPPLVLTIVLLVVFSMFVYVHDAAQRIWEESAAALFYFEDYRVAFGHEPAFGYLAQTWSLSVEEQFYVIWSVLMVVAVAVHRRRLAYGFAIAGIVLSATDRLVLLYHYGSHFTNHDFSRIYNAFDTRADALFFGCILGLLATDGRLQDWGRRSTRLLSVAALVSTGFLIWILFSAPLFSRNVVLWWIPTTTVAAAVIIVYFVICPRGIGSRIVGISLLVFIGDLSYTVYLVHFPVYTMLYPGSTPWGWWPNEILRLVVTFGIAIASWYAIEKPLARWRARSAAQ